MQWQIGMISNFRDGNSYDLYLQGRKIYLSQENIIHLSLVPLKLFGWTAANYVLLKITADSNIVHVFLLHQTPLQTGIKSF